MRSDIAVFNQGVRNANDAISMLQTMDGAAAVIDEKLIRMKELAEQSATGTYSDEQRLIMDDEFEAMREEIDRIARATEFNGITMLDTTSAGAAQAVSDTLDQAGSSALTLVSAIGLHTSGATVTVSYTHSDGTSGTSSQAFTSLSDVSDLLTFFNALSSFDGTASWNSVDGTLTIEGSAVGVSDLAFSYTVTSGGTPFDPGVTTTGAEGKVRVHFGSGNDPAKDYYFVQKYNMTADGFSVGSMVLSDLSITTQASAATALTVINEAIIQKDTARAHFGAMMNRLEKTVENLTIQAENLQAAESQISDVDVAYEMTRFMNTQIKAQAAVAMLSQANSLPHMAMSLLQG
jgi:flagellin